jgi:hypothetical protein
MPSVPGPVELRAWISEKGLTVAQAGRFAGVEARAARRWTSPPDSASFRAIPWSAWALLRLMTKDATLKEIQAEVEKGGDHDV